jgi:hypothetical protein
VWTVKLSAGRLTDTQSATHVQLLASGTFTELADGLGCAEQVGFDTING